MNQQVRNMIYLNIPRPIHRINTALKKRAKVSIDFFNSRIYFAWNLNLIVRDDNLQGSM